ncbi:MAG: AsmA family protein [Rhizobiaceae bacterium]|nr:AsmA family protein [Rhizobiaceae bacterium]
MASALVRRGGMVAVAAAALLGLALLLLPWLASTRLVRDRIAVELGAWSGYRVDIGAPPDIEVWPSFRAVVPAVTLSRWGASDKPPVIEAERIELDLSPWAALRGEVEFSNVRLIRPTLRVDRLDASRYAPEWPAGGRLAAAVEKARRIVAENATAPALEDMPEDAFGRLSFEDGRVVSPSASGEDVIVTDLDGEIAWLNLDTGLTATAKGIWRNEAVQLEMASPRPLLLIAGGQAPLTFSVTSAPATASFDGVAEFGENGFFSGQAKFAAPSMRRVLDWWETAVTPGTGMGSVTISSQVSGNAQRIKFEDAEIALDDNPGTGALELAFQQQKVPVISGSIAFQSLDLRAFLSAFTPLVPEAETSEEAIDGSFASLVNLDLRLSAARAIAGSIELTDLSASTQVLGDLAAFDVSGARAFGGDLQASIRFDRSADGTMVETRLLASDIDGEALGAAAGLTRMVPAGKATVSLILKGPGATWSSMLSRADGSLSVNFGQGTLRGFDLAAFEKRLADGGFFSLAETADGNLKIDAAEIKAVIKDGLARLDKAEARSGAQKIEMSGVVPVVPGGLALRGQISADDAQPADQLRFFVGGSWSAPYISPAYARPMQ